ncbi:hypothetical protein GGS23DRAFT_211512 [Durotheca rogersii]|uniref:uncharacterized protein n=1 Tax=Durotheca rogersii TaxID=419775 RepID=UPI0022208AFA|nr:uncharacterized protein GGS23DRAFT_211512 [Durotheca rogersii]KAI5860814.1 hypothetical protein GGS23DRAFT_211512 [Durotheca rogersii]
MFFLFSLSRSLSALYSLYLSLSTSPSLSIIPPRFDITPSWCGILLIYPSASTPLSFLSTYTPSTPSFLFPLPFLFPFHLQLPAGLHSFVDTYYVHSFTYLLSSSPVRFSCALARLVYLTVGLGVSNTPKTPPVAPTPDLIYNCLEGGLSRPRCDHRPSHS